MANYWTLLILGAGAVLATALFSLNEILLLALFVLAAALVRAWV